ncbi:hypothetical protein Cgig2_006363 [Carnegiea gigantea]|uniref:Uncharacterized protein n=1 Tax=Carnegiea gigantea TaxID=171969 RepID=A0A9Q1QB87_9CARY|nr:hypothetical protein Cgig2_006363 [Carnegiea gigantea]
MSMQIEQRRRSKRQAAIAQDATRRASDDQTVIATSNVLAVEHLNEPEIEDEPVKKHRRPTVLFEVHARKMEDRVVVLFNDKAQPIGPIDKVANEFNKQISAKNSESREQQDNMHTMGAVSFARKHYDLKRMKEIEALQESGLSSSDEDPFDKPQALAPEFIDATRAGLGEEMQKDFDAHKEKMEVDLKAEKDKVANMQKELDAQKVVLDAQKGELHA